MLEKIEYPIFYLIHLESLYNSKVRYNEYIDNKLNYEIKCINIYGFEIDKKTKKAYIMFTKESNDVWDSINKNYFFCKDDIEYDFLSMFLGFNHTYEQFKRYINDKIQFKEYFRFNDLIKI